MAGSVNADLQENISAVREVQASGREDANTEQFRQSNAANRDANIRAASYTSALSPTLEALGYVSMATVARVGGQAILSGGTLLGATIPLGLVITFLNYVQRLNQPTMQISVLWTNIQSAIAGGERIFGLMDAKPDVTDKVDAVEMPSIVKLLPRFYDVTDGRVLVDGYDVRDVTRDSLRSQIGIVLQDTFLFSESVMENIRCGRPDATGEQVMAAARLAKVDTFIERLPEKHDTVLGERGSGLSQ